MSMSLNKAFILGHLARDPEVRHTQAGDAIVNLTVATSESWKDKNSGERKEKAEFHRVVIFNDALGRVAQAHLRKGSRVYLEGSIQTRKWQDKDGADRYSTEIVLGKFAGSLILLDKRDDAGRADEPAQGGGALDDEIPFAAEWR